MKGSSLRRLLLLLLTGSAMLWGAPAHAGPVTCTATMTSLAFGSVDPQSSQTDASATLSYTCTNSGKSVRYVAACFGIGASGSDAVNANPRRMLAGVGQFLPFQIYQDSARTTTPWGSFSGTTGTPLYVPVIVPARGSTSGATTLYGRVLAGQTTAIPGSYQEPLSNNVLMVVDGGSQFPPDCSGGSSGGSSFGAFLVTASVINACSVTANPLDFGTTTRLASSTPVTSTIAVRCSNGTAFNIGLGAGQNSGGNINSRAMAQGGEGIGYQLYSNVGLSAVWGNTVGTNAVTGTGTGSTQSLIIYGNVPVQATPSPGNYSDTVTVYVYY